MTAANVRMISSNTGDSATMTANPAVLASLPVTNLQNALRSRIMRTNSVVSSQEIKLTWPTAQILSALSLIRGNLTSQATWRIQVYSDAAWTTLVYDSGTVNAVSSYGWGEFRYGIDAWGASVYTAWGYSNSVIWFTPVGGQSMKVTITDASNPDGYLQFSRLFCGYYFEPQFNMSYGLKINWKENSSQTRTDGGSLRTDPKTPFRAWSFNLDWLTEAERAQMAEIIRTIGLRNDIFLSCFPAVGGSRERDGCGQAKLISMPDMTTNLYSNWVTPFVFEES